MPSPNSLSSPLVQPVPPLRHRPKIPFINFANTRPYIGRALLASQIKRNASNSVHSDSQIIPPRTASRRTGILHETPGDNVSVQLDSKAEYIEHEDSPDVDSRQPSLSPTVSSTWYPELPSTPPSPRCNENSTVSPRAGSFADPMKCAIPLQTSQNISREDRGNHSSGDNIDDGNFDTVVQQDDNLVSSMDSLTLHKTTQNSRILRPRSEIKQPPRRIVTIVPSRPSNASSSRTSQRFDQYTGFLSRDDDDRNLWAVEKIIAENARSFKVVWAGLNPKDDKPWPPSWVRKNNCTPDLVADWRKLRSQGDQGLFFV
jgi:hypothetical protein